MTWPAPPDGDREDLGGGLAPPWRPVTHTSGPSRPETDGRAEAAPPNAQGRASGGKRHVLPLVGVGVGVVALGLAGWLAVSQGLVPGLGPSAAPDALVVPDVTEEPEEVWSYSYLPRSAEIRSSGMLTHDDRLFSLIGPQDGVVENAGYTISGIDLEEGEELWSIELDLGAHDRTQYVGSAIVGVVGDEVVTRTTSTDYDDDFASTHTYTFIDGTDGTATRAVETDATYQVVGDQGVMLWTDESGVARVDPEDPEGTPLWDVVTTGPVDHISQEGPYLLLSDPGDGQVVVDAETGAEPEWFDGPSHTIRYTVHGDKVYRLETTDRGTYLDCMDDDGSVAWSADADAFFFKTSARGDLVLFAAEKASSEDTTYTYLHRLDPRTGDEVYDEEVEADFDTVGPVVDAVFVLEKWDGERAELYSLDDGERAGRLRGTVHRAGQRTMYSLEDERLRAFDTEGAELWSLRARGASSIFSTPDYLITQDDAAGRLTRWE